MGVDVQHHDAAALLRTEHAVARVLVGARDEANARRLNRPINSTALMRAVPPGALMRRTAA